MPEANSAPILSNPPSRYPRNVPQPAQKPKLLDCLREPLRSRHGVFPLTNVELFGTKPPLPHSSATHLLEAACAIRIIQQLQGYKDVSRTMIYTHILNKGGQGSHSPVDGL